MPLHRPRARSVLSCCAVVGALLGCGCATYVNYPPQMSDVAVHDLGSPPVPRVMAVAVSRVALLWPVDGQYMVNFPRGTERRVAERSVNLIADPRAWTVNEVMLGAPTYHVTRVWVRGDEATVDVIRPVTTADSAEDIGQQITVKLKSGVGESWHAVSVRPWAVGAYEVPELFGWFEAVEAAESHLMAPPQLITPQDAEPAIDLDGPTDSEQGPTL